MGNCLQSSSKVEENNSNPSKVTNITDIPLLPSTPQSESEILSSSNVKVFTLKELRKTTGNFRSDNVIGQEDLVWSTKVGLMGTRLLLRSLEPAWLLLSRDLHQETATATRNGWTKINYLGQLNHPNLVKLIGCCSEGDNRLLVYEFMPCGSLDNHLFRLQGK